MHAFIDGSFGSKKQTKKVVRIMQDGERVLSQKHALKENDVLIMHYRYDEAKLKKLLK